MIAIGGAIGTGLFLGAGGLLAGAGPALALVVAICGVFAFFILRSLGELVLHRPSSGSFVSYAREFYGEKFAYVAGWMYFLNWAITWIVDVTAVALYLHYWSFFTSAPQWLLALIKVVALVAFLAIGIVFLAIQFSLTVGGETVHPTTVAPSRPDSSPSCLWCRASSSPMRVLGSSAPHRAKHKMSEECFRARSTR